MCVDDKISYRINTNYGLSKIAWKKNTIRKMILYIYTHTTLPQGIYNGCSSLLCCASVLLYR